MIFLKLILHAVMKVSIPDVNLIHKMVPVDVIHTRAMFSKEITFRATEDEAQLKWTDISEVHSPFKDIVATSVTIDGTSRVFVDNEDMLGNRSIKATVNNGYEVKVKFLLMAI